jgi:hypothetical protein
LAVGIGFRYNYAARATLLISPRCCCLFSPSPHHTKTAPFSFISETLFFNNIPVTHCPRTKFKIAMMDAVAPLVRRGMTMVSGEGDGEKMKQLPGWGIGLLAVTAVFFVVVLITVCLQALLLRLVADNP